MNTRVLMMASSTIAGVIGLTLTFAPDEIAGLIGSGPFGHWSIVLQLCGALYCAFALLNWMAKGTTLGGIYGRPIVIGNLTHYMIGGLALLKTVSHSASPAWIGLAALYTIFACLYGYVLFAHPLEH